MSSSPAARPPAGRLDKRAFFESIGYAPHPGQWEVHQSKALRRILASGVRWGKTTCAAMEGLAAALEPRERSVGWIAAPTYDLTDRVYRELVLTVHERLKHRLVSQREHERKIVLRNMAGGLSEVKAKSCDNPVSLLGEGLDWLVVDEAARLKPGIWQSHLSQRLIDKMGWALLISTPHGKGWLFDLFRRGQGPDKDPDYESWNRPSRTNPLLDAATIEKERSRIPERVFRQEYEAEFLEGAGAVFRFVRESATGAFEDPKPGVEYVGGLDLAKVEDFTVFVIMTMDRRVVFVDRFHRIDWRLQVQRIVAAYQRYNVSRVLMDSTGSGEPLRESLRSEGLFVKPYPFTSKSKADVIHNLALLLEKRDIVLPNPNAWPEGIDELEAFEYDVTDSGNVTMSAPHGMHDDCVMALTLAAWEARPRLGPVFAFG